MDKEHLLDAVAHTWGQLSTLWGGKLVAGSILGIALSAHAYLLLLFVALVVLDLLTKWLEIARTYLKERQDADTSLYHALFSVGAAHRAGYIRSDVMKHRFLGKICVYLLFTFAAAVVDISLGILSAPRFALVLTVGYLMVTEFLSILENLQAAGVEMAQGLHDLVERKNRL